jgi:cytosine/adenosine deaminase-related metal-dependent hydrolase
MAQSAELARAMGVTMHTHLAETSDEDSFCLETFGKRPLQYAESVGWAGPDVWFAHGVFMKPNEVESMAETRTGIAHCPSSNMRLASGIAPVRDYLTAGVRIGLGVDGSASNDGSHMLGEARQAMLLARLAAAPSGANEAGPMLTARQALEMATIGGAAVLGRDDIGSLEPGKAADFTAFRVDDLAHAGALHDSVAALIFCAPVGATETWVHGTPVVSSGRPVGLDPETLVERHNAASLRLVNG